MVERSNSYSHIPLRLITEGIASPVIGGSRKKNPKTSANFGNRQGHGGKLRRTLEAIIFDWKEEKETREEEQGKPKLDAQRIILQIDPDTFDPDGLKSYGIEVIAELEDGYIIGASADLELSDLQKKIEKFIKEERGGNKVAEIWELIDGKKKPEYILSDELCQHWDQVKDDQIYTVDVGIACVGEKTKLSNYPERKENESDRQFSQRVNRWINNRDMTYQEWDNIRLKREDEFSRFIEYYQGEILKSDESAAKLPDSFSCRIRISGQGLKDLVLNFPYIFDVSEPDEFIELIQRDVVLEGEESSFELESPDINAPKVCVIDSGIQERHSLLRAAIDSNNSRSWVPSQENQTADYVQNGGHGTRVAGAVLYPIKVPRSGKQKAICWLQNARVLDANCKLSEQLFPPNLLGEIVEIYHKNVGTKIFNHSITGSVPCRTQYMSAWASVIDQLTWQNDILFIVAAGNLPLNQRINPTRLSVQEHLIANRLYPDYLLEDSCRIANPAQSFQALTIGSVAHTSYHDSSLTSMAQKDRPSAFSCSGFGIWDSIKPEVVEYGGDFVKDSGQPPSLTYPKNVCPELVRSTMNGGPAVASDQVGTSFATPKVSHIAACLAAAFPDQSCLLYRALIVQSARWPEWTKEDNIDQSQVLRLIGYGIPDLNRAIGNAPNRITLITQGEKIIKARQAHVYQIILPEKLRSPGEELEFLLEVTLSYKAQPRRTRRNRRRYLSTWLDWDCSKRGEEPESFLARILREYDAPENAEKGEGAFSWTLGKQKNHGRVKKVSRSSGTLQKDWTIVKSYELRETFCIAVVGHEGWNNGPDAEVPYSLVVSFEALEPEIPVYTEISKAEIQVPIEVEEKV
jgi:hypothetical protein